MPNGPDTSRMEEAMAEILAQLPSARKNCRIIMEHMVGDETADLDEVVKYYSYCYPRPLMALTQDLQRQAAIYVNLLEEIKGFDYESINNDKILEEKNVPGYITIAKS